jgi:exonuclease VII small subunit
LPKFEECIQRLEKIVQELEQGEVPLEILLKQNGKIQAEPFDRP